jgi:hypothetical protein
VKKEANKIMEIGGKYQIKENSSGYVSWEITLKKHMTCRLFFTKQKWQTTTTFNSRRFRLKNVNKLNKWNKPWNKRKFVNFDADDLHVIFGNAWIEIRKLYMCDA